MAWTVEFSAQARKQLKALDRPVQRRLIDFLESRVTRNPRAHGEAMTGPFSGFWKYRVGDYRVVCELEAARLVVWVLKVGHRREVYRR